jgi:trimeric autotransporter adhesin
MSSTSQLQKPTRSYSRSRLEQGATTSKTDWSDEAWSSETTTSRCPGVRRCSSLRDLSDGEETTPSSTSGRALSQQSSSRSGALCRRAKGQSEEGEGVESPPVRERSRRSISRSRDRSRSQSLHNRSHSHSRLEKRTTPTSKMECSDEAWSNKTTTSRRPRVRRCSSLRDLSDGEETTPSTSGSALSSHQRLSNEAAMSSTRQLQKPTRSYSRSRLEQTATTSKTDWSDGVWKNETTSRRPGVRRCSSLRDLSDGEETTPSTSWSTLSRQSSSRSGALCRRAKEQSEEGEGHTRESPVRERYRRGISRPRDRSRSQSRHNRSHSHNRLEKRTTTSKMECSDEAWSNETTSRCPGVRRCSSLRDLSDGDISTPNTSRSVLSQRSSSRRGAPRIRIRDQTEVDWSSTKIAAMLSSISSHEDKLRNTKFIARKYSREDDEIAQKEMSWKKSQSDPFSTSRNQNTPSVPASLGNHRNVQRRSAGFGLWDSSDEEPHSPPPATRVMPAAGRRATMQKASKASALNSSAHNRTMRVRKVSASLTQNASVLSLLAGTLTTSCTAVDSATENMDCSVAQGAKPAKLSAKGRKAVKELQAFMQ